MDWTITLQSMEASLVPLYPKQTSKVSSCTKPYLVFKFPAATGSSHFLESEPADIIRGRWEISSLIDNRTVNLFPTKIFESYGYLKIQKKKEKEKEKEIHLHGANSSPQIIKMHETVQQIH